jgi:hypothetical protein
MLALLAAVVLQTARLAASSQGRHAQSFQRAAFVHGDVAQTSNFHLNRFW